MSQTQYISLEIGIVGKPELSSKLRTRSKFRLKNCQLQRQNSPQHLPRLSSTPPLLSSSLKARDSFHGRIISFATLSPHALFTCRHHSRCKVQNDTSPSRRADDDRPRAHSLFGNFKSLIHIGLKLATDASSTAHRRRGSSHLSPSFRTSLNFSELPSASMWIVNDRFLISPLPTLCVTSCNMRSVFWKSE